MRSYLLTQYRGPTSRVCPIYRLPLSPIDQIGRLDQRRTVLAFGLDRSEAFATFGPDRLADSIEHL